jgi:hypothetical protein
MNDLTGRCRTSSGAGGARRAISRHSRSPPEWLLVGASPGGWSPSMVPNATSTPLSRSSVHTSSVRSCCQGQPAKCAIPSIPTIVTDLTEQHEVPTPLDDPVIVSPERVYEELAVRRSSLNRYEDAVRLGFVRGEAAIGGLNRAAGSAATHNRGESPVVHRDLCGYRTRDWRWLSAEEGCSRAMNGLYSLFSGLASAQSGGRVPLFKDS